MDRFPGMTPDRVDELPIDLYNRIPLVADVAEELREEQRRRRNGG